MMSVAYLSTSGVSCRSGLVLLFSGKGIGLPSKQALTCLLASSADIPPKLPSQMGQLWIKLSLSSGSSLKSSSWPVSSASRRAISSSRLLRSSCCFWSAARAAGTFFFLPPAAAGAAAGSGVGAEGVEALAGAAVEAAGSGFAAPLAFFFAA